MCHNVFNYTKSCQKMVKTNRQKTNKRLLIPSLTNSQNQQLEVPFSSYVPKTKLIGYTKNLIQPYSNFP